MKTQQQGVFRTASDHFDTFHHHQGMHRDRQWHDGMLVTMGIPQLLPWFQDVLFVVVVIVVVQGCKAEVVGGVLSPTQQISARRGTVEDLCAKGSRRKDRGYGGVRVTSGLVLGLVLG